MRGAAETAGLEVLRILDEASSTLRAYNLHSKRCRGDECIYVTYNIRGEETYLALVGIDRGAVDTIGTVTNVNLGLEDSEASVKTAQTGLNSLNKQQSAQVNGLIKQLLIDAKFQKNDVDGIIITGDSPHTLAIQEVLETYFPGKKVLAPPGFEHDEAFVYGASLWGSIYRENLDAGYEVLDVNPLSLGIETSSGSFLRVISRNTVIGAQRTLTVSTSADDQERVNIRILEGEREIAGRNRLIGTLRLSGIPPAPKGVPEIKITLVWGWNEILTATAQLKGASRVAKFDAPVKVDRYTEERKDDIIRDAEEKFYEKDLEKLKEGSIRVLHGVDWRKRQPGEPDKSNWR
jgi:molecular chaperone DnaK (HSP70)